MSPEEHDQVELERAQEGVALLAAMIASGMASRENPITNSLLLAASAIEVAIAIRKLSRAVTAEELA